MSEKFLPLLKVNSSQINSRVLVCGDPARAEKIANRLDKAQEISYNREYRLFNGQKDGVPLSIASHGVGASGAAVCFEELIRGGAEEIIRVGTAGSLAPELVQDGDLVIASGAIREDGLTFQLIDMEYPAIADHRITARLEDAARKVGIKTNTGIVLTVAAFYPGIDEVPNDYYSNAKALAVEMEASALFVICSLHGVKAGAILAVDGIAVDWDAESYDPHRDLVDEAVENEIEIAIKALIGE